MADGGPSRHGREVVAAAAEYRSVRSNASWSLDAERAWYDVAMKRQPRRTGLSVARLLVPLIWLVASGAGATTISGVEFSNWDTIDVPGGVDLDLHTLGDLYVFIPNGLFTDQVTFIAEDMIVFEAGVVLDPNDPLLCDAGCVLENFDEAGDIVLRIFDPVGNVTLSARNIVVSNQPIPEPGSFSLLALGLSALACGRMRGSSSIRGPASEPRSSVSF